MNSHAHNPLWPVHHLAAWKEPNPAAHAQAGKRYCRPGSAEHFTPLKGAGTSREVGISREGWF